MGSRWHSCGRSTGATAFSRRPTRSGRAGPEMWASLKGMRKEGWGRVPAAEEASRSKQPVAIEDAVGSTLIPASWQEAFRTRARLGLPLVAKDEVIGVMLLDDT